MLVDTISQDVRNELPWELLYADDLAIIDVTSTDTQNRQCGKNRSSVNKGKPAANRTEWRRTEEC